MLCYKDSEIFSQLISRTSERLDISTFYVEKDYYTVLVLKRIMAISPTLVFKGGTSLSKCHHIIERFSEDIDISSNDPNLNRTTRRMCLHGIEDELQKLSIKLINPNDIRSGRLFNRFECRYPSVVDADSAGEMIIEFANQSVSFPNEIKPIQSFIGEYLTEMGRQDLVSKYELEPFEVQTQSLVRTFVDKVYAICDYHISKQLRRQSRHIYDLHHLMTKVNLDDSLISLFKEIYQLRVDNPACHSAKTGMRLSVLLNELIEKKTYYADYQTLTLPLLYDQTPYDECVKAIKQIADFLEKNGL